MSKKFVSVERLALALQTLKEKVVLKEVGKGLFSGKYADLTGKPTIPSKTSELQNDSSFVDATTLNGKGYLTKESDPTVPAWAKASSKPTYTAAEVGALPSDTAIPTKVSQLTNDSGFQTSSQVSSAITKATSSLASQSYVGQQIAAAAHLKREKVSTLPAVSSANENTIYMVPKSGSGNDVYNEYMLIDGKFELIGNSAADLTNYLQESNEASESEITALFTGW